MLLPSSYIPLTSFLPKAESSPSCSGSSHRPFSTPTLGWGTFWFVFQTQGRTPFLSSSFSPVSQGAQTFDLYLYPTGTEVIPKSEAAPLSSISPRLGRVTSFLAWPCLQISPTPSSDSEGPDFPPLPPNNQAGSIGLPGQGHLLL